MTFVSNLGSNPFIIDDSNADQFVQQSRDDGFSTGYEPRPYDTQPEGFFAPVFNSPIIPRSQWDDHIKRQEDEQSSPDHWRIRGGVPVLDQNGYGYCWMYGPVGAIMTAYAQTGGYVPHLSAMGPAAQGKNWRNQGGYGGEAIRYIERFGIPELSVWPEHKNDRSLPNKPEVKASAEKHKVVEFLELPRSNFNALMSVLLDPINPRPVTMALNWWGHLVYGVKAVKISAGKYGVKIVNSWKPSWGDQGTSVLTESKATAFEQIAIQRVKVRAA